MDQPEGCLNARPQNSIALPPTEDPEGERERAGEGPAEVAVMESVGARGTAVEVDARLGVEDAPDLAAACTAKETARLNSASVYTMCSALDAKVFQSELQAA